MANPNLTATGTVERVSRKPGKGPRFLLSDGEWYSVWEESNFQAEEGDDVTFSYKLNGQWRNTTGKVLGSIGSGGSKTTSTATRPRSAAPDSPLAIKIPRERCIVLQSAAKAAIDFLSALPDTDKKALLKGFSAEEILDARPVKVLADAIASYTSGDDLFKKAASEVSATDDSEVEVPEGDVDDNF